MQQNAAAGNQPGFKVVLCGDVAVGKSNIMLRYMSRDEYRPVSQATMGPGFSSKVVDVGGRKVKALVWDTAGQDTFRSITQLYYRGAAAAVLVYDITRLETFENIDSWYNDVMRGCHNQNVVIALLGNKLDLVSRPELGSQREVELERAAAYAESKGMLHFEVSAYDDLNIVEAFDALMAEVVARDDAKPQAPVPGLRCPCG